MVQGAASSAPPPAHTHTHDMSCFLLGKLICKFISTKLRLADKECLRHVSNFTCTWAARTRHRRNALHYACEEGRDDVVKVLLASGTNAFAKVMIDRGCTLFPSKTVPLLIAPHGPISSSWPVPVSTHSLRIQYFSQDVNGKMPVDLATRLGHSKKSPPQSLCIITYKIQIHCN